jgi:hypothetical protein
MVATSTALFPDLRKVAFARHETFHPRFGWLKKGFDAAQQGAQQGEAVGIFTADDAVVRLGVGKNMVRSIRYWCNAFQVLEDDQPTELGEKLLGDEGWDTFLENPASLWLLHWQLLQNPEEATAWAIAFFGFHAVEFSPDDLLASLEQYSEASPGKKTAVSSLKKDMNCILRMYSEPELQRGAIEDSINSPFSGLGLISRSRKQYKFCIGEKENLPPEIIVYACLKFAETSSAKTISVSRLTYDPHSPGLTFKLPERVICDAIADVESRDPRVAVRESEGLLQFSFTEDPNSLADDILEQYYTEPVAAL